MMHLLRKYDIARFTRNDAMFAINVAKPRIIREANIIGVANIICRRQTSFKKRTFVLVDKGSFFVGGDRWIRTIDPMHVKHVL